MPVAGKCVVKCCKNALRCKKYEKKEEKVVTYHRFPKNKQRRQQWAKALQLNEVQVTDEHRVCSNHFFEKDFDRSLCIVRLQGNAVPFVFYEILSESNDNSNVIKSEAKPLSVEILDKYLDKDVLKSSGSTPKKCPSPNCSEFMTKHVETQKNEELLGCDEETECDSKKEFVEQATSVSPHRNLKKRNFVDRATSVSPERIFHSPTKQRMRENFKKQLQKGRQEKNRVSRKLHLAELKIASMQKVINKLRERNFLSEGQRNKSKK